jgi:predicted nucleic acid-binding protein
VSLPNVGQVVLDSSVVVALLADRGELGEWAASTLKGRRAAAPWPMPFEVGNSLRRRELAGDIDATASTLAHEALLSMRLDLWPHRRLAERAWELRGAVTYYDASYVALAELLDAPLVTLDRRLGRAPGPQCAFLTPPED